MIRLSFSKQPTKGKADNMMRTVTVVAVIGGVSGMVLLGFFICRRGSRGKIIQTSLQENSSDSHLNILGKEH